LFLFLSFRLLSHEKDFFGVIQNGTSGICVEEDPISLFDRASPVRCAGETPTIPADVLSEWKKGTADDNKINHHTKSWI